MPHAGQENILIYILANLSYLTRLSSDVLTEQRFFYGLKAGWGFEICITFATILYGFALAGLGRSLIVEPKKLVWPGVLGNTALNAALHSRNSDISPEYVIHRPLSTSKTILTPYVERRGRPADINSFSTRSWRRSVGTGFPTLSSLHSRTLRGCAGLHHRMLWSINCLA